MEVQSEDHSVFSRDHVKYWDGSFFYNENGSLSDILVKQTILGYLYEIYNIQSKH